MNQKLIDLCPFREKTASRKLYLTLARSDAPLSKSEIAKSAHLTVARTALLLAACFGWVLQNDLIRFSAREAALVETTPLRVEIFPESWTSWCDTANVGWGGLLLLTSLFYRGQRSAALAILGAGIAVYGHKLGIRTVEPIRDYHVAMMLGTVLALVGFRLGRR